MFIETIMMDRELPKSRTVIMTLAGKPVRVSDPARLERIIASGALTRSDVVSVQEADDFVAQPADQVVELRELFDKLDPPPAIGRSGADPQVAQRTISRAEPTNAATPASSFAGPIDTPLGAQFEHAVKLLIDIFETRLSMAGADVIALDKDSGTIQLTLKAAHVAVENLRQKISARRVRQECVEQERVEQARAQDFAERMQIERDRAARVEQDRIIQVERERLVQVERIRALQQDRIAQVGRKRRAKFEQERDEREPVVQVEQGTQVEQQEHAIRKEPRRGRVAVPWVDHSTTGFVPTEEYRKYYLGLCKEFNKILEGNTQARRFIGLFSPMTVKVADNSVTGLHVEESDVGLQWLVRVPSDDRHYMMMPGIMMMQYPESFFGNSSISSELKNNMPCYQVESGPFSLIRPALLRKMSDIVQLEEEGIIICPVGKSGID